jgi:hypothetical protein
MYLPIQRQPVQRTLAGQPCANHMSSSVGGPDADPSGQSFRAGEYGVQPSGFDVGSAISSILPILASFF